MTGTLIFKHLYRSESMAFNKKASYVRDMLAPADPVSPRRWMDEELLLETCFGCGKFSHTAKTCLSPCQLPKPYLK